MGTTVICTETEAKASHEYKDSTYEAMCRYHGLTFEGPEKVPTLATEDDAEWWQEYERVAEECQKAADERGVAMGDLADELGADWSDPGFAIDEIAEELGVLRMFSPSRRLDVYRTSRVAFDCLSDRAFEAYGRYRELMEKALAVPSAGDYNRIERAYEVYKEHREPMERAAAVADGEDRELLSDFHSYHSNLLEYYSYRLEAERAYGLCEGICVTLDMVRGLSIDDDEDTAMDLVRDRYKRIHGSK